MFRGMGREAVVSFVSTWWPSSALAPPMVATYVAHKVDDPEARGRRMGTSRSLPPLSLPSLCGPPPEASQGPQPLFSQSTHARQGGLLECRVACPSIAWVEVRRKRVHAAGRIGARKPRACSRLLPGREGPPCETQCVYWSHLPADSAHLGGVCGGGGGAGQRAVLGGHQWHRCRVRSCGESTTVRSTHCYWLHALTPVSATLPLLLPAPLPGPPVPPRLQ